MNVLHGDVEYSLPTEWWVAADMQHFRPDRDAFRVDRTGTNLPVIEVALNDVEPCRRKLSHGVFNDCPPLTAQERVARILRAFREDTPLPPIDLVRTERDEGPRFRLYHGVHRFCCAMFAGFTLVPAMDVTDELKKI